MTPDPALILWHWCAALLGIAANAAATLPLMAALALILGRRGHAALCLRGAAARAGLGLWLSAAFPAPGRPRQPRGSPPFSRQRALASA